MIPIEIGNPAEVYDRRQIPHFEKNTIISSNHVTHFTPKFNTLLKIIEQGFKPSYCNESPIYLKEYEELEALTRLVEAVLPNIENVRIPMVCFCDIPIKQSYSQRKIFGKYGISLKKDWAMSNWITPVTYVAENTKNHSILFSIYALVENAIRFHRSDEFKNDDNPYLIALQNRIQNYMDYVKPYFNFKDNRKYYDEREWRYIPDNFSEEDREDPEKYLKFQLNDIYQINVTTAEERSIVIKLLKEMFDDGSKKIVKIRHK
ncbi:MAG: abortive infection system antitoxin AbiGi family protein [Bacteroidales bacterium]